MIDFEVLKIIWWIVIGLILVAYATTAGFDLGVTLIMPFFKDETDRRVLLNTSAPVWDGNQTWLVFAGGALFVVWPAVYSLAFSGMYAAMLCILWGFFLRPPGYDYRSKINHPAWKRMWDVGLFISALIPVFSFGLASGNCIVGFNFSFDPITMRDTFDQSFWHLLSLYGILSGLTAVSMVVMHGAAYLIQRTETDIREKAKLIHKIFWTITITLFSFVGLMLFFQKGYLLIHSPINATEHPLQNIVKVETGAWIYSFIQYPWKVIGPITAYLGFFITIWANLHNWSRTCFWGSVIALAGIVGSSGMALFPFIMPSATNPSQSITVWNAVSTQYALTVMFYVGIVMLSAILIYKIFSYHVLWSKTPIVRRKDILEKDHELY